MKFFLTTLGCKVNQFESVALAQSLKQYGWLQSTDGKNVDLFIINTCTVTQKASSQSRQAIRKAIRSNPDARIVVTGCYAQTEADKIKKIRGVSHVIGQQDKSKIPRILSGLTEKITRKEIDISSKDQDRQNFFLLHPVTGWTSRTRPFLKIQDGCDAHCTYCIVPIARGRSRSMPFSEVLGNMEELGAAGFKETVLTGIHLGCYGLDLTPKTDLFKLLKAIEEQKSVKRIRLSSIEPRELTKHIIKLATNSHNICPHFHIPLQSGDDRILKKMKRPYTAAFFRDLVNQIHVLIPHAAIGVDTLIGFPGETQKVFENTYALIKELPITYLHVFPFSPRKQTPAASYPNQVKPDILKARCSKMRGLGKTKKRAFYKKFIGQTVEVLVEGKRDLKTGYLKGLTSNYIPVLVQGEDKLMNTFINAKIEKLNRNDTVSGIKI